MKESVQNYYGEVLAHSDNLQTNACCTGDAPPAYMRDILSKIHDEVSSRYYGCGLVMPEALSGARILDLGSGAGRDCYALSALVGEKGSVVGVDMTPQQLAIANKHRDFHAQAFGFNKPNVTFIEGELEHLDKLDLTPNSFDVIISNCVINLCTDKTAVLKHAWHLLKEGGEFYFSDVYADRRIPTNLSQDPILYGECLSGAYYWNDFINAAKTAGFIDPRLVESSPITIENEQLEQRVGNIKFYSATYRLFKLAGLEPACEDYGQAVIYNGGIAHHPDSFSLDGHHIIEKGRIFPVCGNTFRMLNESRFKQYFTFIGNFDNHFGIFPGCGTAIPFADELSAAANCC